MNTQKPPLPSNRKDTALTLSGQTVFQSATLLLLLLMITFGEAAFGQDRQKDAKTPLARIAGVEAALSEIDVSKRPTSTTSEDLMRDLAPKFQRWAALMTDLSAVGQHAEADRIATAIIEMRNAIDPAFFPRNSPDAFVRDRFPAGPYRVDAAQFFEPVRYYPDDDRIMKLYRFSVYMGETVVARYYLERSTLAEDYYVLGYTDHAVFHRQVKPYGPHLPSYAELKTSVLADLATHQIR